MQVSEGISVRLGGRFPMHGGVRELGAAAAEQDQEEG